MAEVGGEEVHLSFFRRSVKTLEEAVEDVGAAKVAQKRATPNGFLIVAKPTPSGAKQHVFHYTKGPTVTQKATCVGPPRLLSRFIHTPTSCAMGRPRMSLLRVCLSPAR